MLKWLKEVELMFNPVKSKKIYQYVIEQIQEMIMNGTLKDGDKLPSERILAEELDVSRASIREAIRALEILGIVESRQGEGNFICLKIGERFFEPLSIMFKLGNGKPEEILKLRMIIEVEAAAIAATRIKDEEVLEIEALIKEFEDAENSEELAKIDQRLHYMILQIAGNSLMINLMDTISSLMESFIRKAQNIIESEVEWKAFLIQEHKGICDALCNRDPEKAASEMRKHLEDIERTFLEI